MERYTFGIKGEEHVLKKFKPYPIFNGIKKIPASGSQFYAKEDLRSDLFIIQVKTTEDQQYRIQHKDFALLDSWGVKNCLLPLFVVYFEVHDVIKVIFDVSSANILSGYKMVIPKNIPTTHKNIPILYISPDQIFQLKEYSLFLTDAKTISN